MASSVLLMAAYFVLFGVIHSVLAGMRIKRLARRIFGMAVDRWYRLAYVTIALILR